MKEERLLSKFTFILHADIADSTALVGQDEGLAHKRIQGSFRRFSDIIAKYHGHVRELRGDALLAEFERASDVVTAALAFQAAHSGFLAQLDDAMQPKVRVGIAMGEVIVADKTMTGEGVVLAQRVEQLAAPGGVCITGAIREALPRRMPFDQDDLGEQKVKGFDEPVRVYKVRLRQNAALPDPTVAAERRRTPAMQRIMVAAAVVLLCGVALLAWFQPWQKGRDSVSVKGMAFPLPDKPSIAVLPFDNLSNDQSQEYFVDGLTDDLITDLSKVSGLFVIARNSVFTFKDKAVRIKTVARELGVRYVVEGSVRRAGDRIRVNAQLVEGSTGHHIWAQRYDREVTDLFGVQDELIGKIVSALAVRLTQNEEAQLTQRRPPEFEAYELYLKAREGYFSRDHVRMRESLDLFVKATPLIRRLHGLMPAWRS